VALVQVTMEPAVYGGVYWYLGRDGAVTAMENQHGEFTKLALFWEFWKKEGLNFLPR